MQKSTKKKMQLYQIQGILIAAKQCIDAEKYYKCRYGIIAKAVLFDSIYEEANKYVETFLMERKLKLHRGYEDDPFLVKPHDENWKRWEGKD